MRVTPAGLQHLAASGTLQRLDVSFVPVTDNGLRQVSQILQLCFLKLIGSQITDNGLQHVQHLTALTELVLDGFRDLHGAGMQHLGALKELRILDVDRGTFFSDFQHLSTLSTLKELFLRSRVCRQFGAIASTHQSACFEP